MSKKQYDPVHTWTGESTADAYVPWRTAFSALARHARERGSDPWLTTVSDMGEESTLTYRMADTVSRSIAGRLITEFGGSRGTLALAPRNDIPSVLTVLGALRAGFALLLLGPADPAERRVSQVAAAGALAVLHTPGASPPDGPAALVLPDWRSMLDEEPARLRGEPKLDPSDDALFFATSGSTAASKLVAQTHRNAVANAEALRLHHGLCPGDRILGCLPIHHVNGLHFTVLGTMMAGAHAVLAESFSPLTYPGLLARYRPRVASVVPSLLESLLEVWRRPQLPTGFEYFVSAAAPLSGVTARAVADRLGARVLQGYGLSETTNFSTTMPRGLSESDYRRLMLDTDIPSVGVALPGNNVAVLDDAQRELPPGRTGEVCMRGTNVMARYAGNQAATDEAFRGGWFHSQDLGYRIEVGGRNYFVLTGRMKNIAKVAGETVSLEEMDRVLRSVPHVRDAASVAVPDRFAGERIAAAVVLDPGGDLSSLDGPLRACFPEAVLPDRIVSLPEIPRTTTGKVLRPRLEAELRSLTTADEHL